MVTAQNHPIIRLYCHHYLQLDSVVIGITLYGPSKPRLKRYPINLRKNLKMKRMVKIYLTVLLLLNTNLYHHLTAIRNNPLSKSNLILRMMIHRARHLNLHMVPTLLVNLALILPTLIYMIKR